MKATADHNQLLALLLMAVMVLITVLLVLGGAHAQELPVVSLPNGIAPKAPAPNELLQLTQSLGWPGALALTMWLFQRSGVSKAIEALGKATEGLTAYVEAYKERTRQIAAHTQALESLSRDAGKGVRVLGDAMEEFLDARIGGRARTPREDGDK